MVYVPDLVPAGTVTIPVFTSTVGVLPPPIGVAGVTTVMVTLPVGPAVGVLPPKLSLVRLLPAVWVVTPLPTVKVSLATVRVAAPTVTTTVRVPVYRSHSESVLVETAEPVSVEAFKAACEKFPGLQVKDNPAEQIYPMPLYTSNQNDCEIGRIRKDLYNDKGMNFWIVGDQIRKGAALNALQIAEYLVEKQAF